MPYNINGHNRLKQSVAVLNPPFQEHPHPWVSSVNLWLCKQSFSWVTFKLIFIHFDSVCIFVYQNSHHYHLTLVVSGFFSWRPQKSKSKKLCHKFPVFFKKKIANCWRKKNYLDSVLLLRTTSDNHFFFLMFSYGFQYFIIVYVNVKFNLN
jgi:hypothetical protein